MEAIMTLTSQQFHDELRPAAPDFKEACRAIKTVRDDAVAFRDKARELRERARGEQNTSLEKVATEILVRAEDRVTEMTGVLRQMVAFARKEAGLQIDPETAEVNWKLEGGTLDLYGIDPDLPERCQQIRYFARSPVEDVWVSFCDLPEETTNALLKRLERGDFDRNDEPPCRSLPGAM
jgi:hypothetical protein